jgi:hypothetical protein
MKAKASALCEVAPSSSTRHWREDAGLMDFLRAL